jgi:Zn finger protein HypA/HybF involved in hydrogenase expression
MALRLQLKHSKHFETTYVKGHSMIEAKFICPGCSAIIVTTRPDVLLWERCPACGSHMWDLYDLMMAEAVKSRVSRSYYQKSSVRVHTQ